MKVFSHQTLLDTLDYDPETGVFAWRKPQSNRVLVGERAGVVGVNGRRYISVFSEKYMAHRLAWFYVHGTWPTGDLRQKNGNFDDCSIVNLEDVSRAETRTRSSMFSTNTSGYRGVSPAKGGRWQASITRNYKQVHLGHFDTAEEASAAYEAAAPHMEVAITEDERSAAARAVTLRRRLRVAWGKLTALQIGTQWASFEEFAATVSDVPPRHSVVPLDPALPLGPLNYKCEPDLSTGFDLRTREGRVAFNRAHRQQNPDVYRDRELRKRFGISLAEYREKESAQNGVCAICQQSETMARNDKEVGLAVDHDHVTGKIRDLLCSQCNQGLGKFEDSPDLLRRAAEYLERHGKRSTSVMTDMDIPLAHQFLLGYVGHG
jgi:Demerecviridae HNH endonuclease